MKTLMTVICFLMMCVYAVAEDVDSDDAAQAEINEIMSKLVQNKDLIDVQNREGETALNLFARGDNVEAVQELVSAGADVNLPNDAGDTPLISVACYNKTSQNVEIAKILIENKAEINAQEDIGLTALHCAIGQRQFTLALFLLNQEGVDIFIEDDDGDTVLHMLASIGVLAHAEGMEQEEIIESLKMMLGDEMDSSEANFLDI